MFSSFCKALTRFSRQSLFLWSSLSLSLSVWLWLCHHSHDSDYILHDEREEFLITCVQQAKPWNRIGLAVQILTQEELRKAQTHYRVIFLSITHWRNVIFLLPEQELCLSHEPETIWKIFFINIGNITIKNNIFSIEEKEFWKSNTRFTKLHFINSALGLIVLIFEESSKARVYNAILRWLEEVLSHSYLNLS